MLHFNLTSRSLTLGLILSLLPLACADDKGSDDANTETGDGDGDPTGDGDGDPTGDGDGDPTGDGDGDPTGDGDGDPTGDGDGDPTGDGDGDPTGDGDGDPTGDGDGDPDLCKTSFETCDGLKAAFAAETAQVRSCDADEQCGVELSGTSCGCTNNWVARLDADTSCFYALIDQAQEIECELFLASTCDCPPADGFACNQGMCTWNYL
jgi:hypothetical protein